MFTERAVIGRSIWAKEDIDRCYFSWDNAECSTVSMDDIKSQLYHLRKEMSHMVCEEKPQVPEEPQQTLPEEPQETPPEKPQEAPAEPEES